MSPEATLRLAQTLGTALLLQARPAVYGFGGTKSILDLGGEEKPKGVTILQFWSQIGLLSIKLLHSLVMRLAFRPAAQNYVAMRRMTLVRAAARVAIGRVNSGDPGPSPRGWLSAVWLYLVLVVAVSAAAVSPAQAMRAELWDRWTDHQRGAAAQINHDAWNGLLDTYLRRAGTSQLFDYRGVTSADKARLAQYVGSLAGVSISRYSRPEQLAFWINFYNALTIKVVLDNYPVDSIREIDSTFRIGGPWDEKRVTVEGEKLSLDDIEHRIIRPIWRDARVHYALNCAAKGCPNLAPLAFTAKNTEALLEAGARAYINDARGVHVRGGDLFVSSLYAWYREDFGGSDAGVLAHLKTYAEPSLRAELAAIKRIKGDRYDWNLNDVR